MKLEDHEELLGTELFKDLFSHIRIIYQKAKLQATVLETFHEFLMKKKLPPNMQPKPKKLVDEVIVPYAEAYSDIKDANYERTSGADAINRLLKWLDRIDNTDWCFLLSNTWRTIRTTR